MNLLNTDQTPGIYARVGAKIEFGLESMNFVTKYFDRIVDFGIIILINCDG